MSLQPATFPGGAWDGTTDYRGPNDDKSPNYALTDRFIAELVAVQDYLIGTGLLPSIQLGEANQVLGMDSGATTLEYKPVTIDLSGNITSAGTLRLPQISSAAGSGLNSVGTNLILGPGPSTGSAATSKLLVKSSIVGSSSTTAQTQFNAVEFGSDGQVIGYHTDATTQTWRLSGIASGGNVLGQLDLGTASTGPKIQGIADGGFVIRRNSGGPVFTMSFGFVTVPVNGAISWSGTAYTSGTYLPAADLQLSRVAGALLQVNNGTVGVLRGIQAASIEQIAATGANTVASDFAIKIGPSTGNAASAKFIVQAPAAGTTGTTVQTLSDTFIFERNQLTLRKTGGTATQQFTVAHDATNDYIRFTKAQNSSGDAFLWNVSGSDVFAITRSGGAQLAGGWWLRWCNGVATATADVGLTRVSPGLLAVFNGVSATTFADFQIQNLVTDTTTGTKIGTSATQKLGFFNATPIVQAVLATGSTVDQVIVALQNLGLVRQS